jgi:hypothetical protein
MNDEHEPKLPFALSQNRLRLVLLGILLDISSLYRTICLIQEPLKRSGFFLMVYES